MFKKEKCFLVLKIIKKRCNDRWQRKKQLQRKRKDNKFLVFSNLTITLNFLRVIFL